MAPLDTEGVDWSFIHGSPIVDGLRVNCASSHRYT